MKHIWYIDGYNFELNEGYVNNDYRDHVGIFVYDDETEMHVKEVCDIENVFENKETAINILKGMIEIQRNKLQKHIDDCTRKREELFEKLLNI